MVPHRVLWLRRPTVARKQSTTAPKPWFTGAVGAAIIAATVAGCGSGYSSSAVPVGPTDLAVCVNQVTGMRVPDFQCGGESSLGAALAAGMLWDYVNTSRYPNFVVPAVGVRMPATIVVVHTVPRSVSVGRSLSASGGRVSSLRTQVAQRNTGAGSKPAGGAGVKPAPKPAPGAGSKGIQRGGFGVPSGRTSGGSGSGFGSSRSHSSGS